MVRVFYHWLLIATLVLVSNVLSQGFSNTESGPILVDPQGRNAEQLLGDANQNRASNRLSEAVILAYLALKAANADPASAASIRARAHLFLSEAMDDFGYRAMERIHAKAADRERAGDALASSTLDPAPFYSRLGAVAMHGGDFSVAEYYLHRALDAYEKTKPPNPLAIAATLVHLAELKIKQADVHRVLNRDALSKLKVVEANLERAFSLVDKADNLKLSMAIYELQAKLLLLLSSHLPEANQIFAQKLLEQAEGMFRQALDRRQKDRGSRLREQLPLLNGLMSVLRRTGRFVEAMDVTGVLLDITEQIQQGDPDIALNMALASEHLGNKELTRKLCDMVMTQEEARVAEVSSKSGEAIALAFTAKGRHQSMVSLALLSRSGAQDDNHARLMLDIVLRRKAIVTDAERTFWKTLYEDPAPDLQRAR